MALIFIDSWDGQGGKKLFGNKKMGNK